VTLSNFLKIFDNIFYRMNCETSIFRFPSVAHFLHVQKNEAIFTSRKTHVC